MRRVLHIIGKMDRAGAETMLMNLYRSIDRSKFQFDFVTFTTEKGDYDEEILSLGGKIIPIVAKDSVGRMVELYRFLKIHPEYKIVHSHVLLNNAFQLTAASLAGVKMRISHSHNTSNGGKGAIVSAYEKLAKKTINRLATHKIACGSEASTYLYGDDDNVIILPNAVDVKAIQKTVNESRKNSPFDSNVINIIQVARFMPVKNHAFVLDIAAALQAKQTNFVIHLVGDGQLRTQIEEQVTNRKLTDHIKFWGLRTDVIELMANADLMILPSLHEGFPVVLVESQAAGLPTLVSNTVAKEVDLGLGLVQFLPIDNAEIWAEKVMNFAKFSLSDEQIFNTLSQQGFDIYQNAIALQQLYES
ncbi:glycosyltransferase family 1 protein [Moraxella osloensis]|uniref:Glycosyltransferase family 1 protein n=1 Tax=Faucicola osloensis TaxID=34062 RepID=A0AAD0AEZ2_FAUOS|nr:glycosyltransferase family 1 protein [Moraxella osloensis]ATQ83454.1 glycosyltransferase family 1 protein [Moraxella osloensis]ATW85948.1 glycosyltransferase family 1 protein [Moraxella osloensis]